MTNHIESDVGGRVTNSCDDIDVTLVEPPEEDDWGAPCCVDVLVSTERAGQRSLN